ncbi:MAG TPA: hypothetical protein VIF64_12050 [Pyrinomonadaceae bacterium]|jgi:hypothetical protein
MNPLKINFIHLLQLLSSVEDQDRYQSEVNVDIAGELVCMWFDDFYGRGVRERLAPLLSARELELVDGFHSYYEARVDHLPQTYAKLRESERWGEVRQKARDTLTTLGWDKVQTVWGFGAV